MNENDLLLQDGKKNDRKIIFESCGLVRRRSAGLGLGVGIYWCLL